MELLENERGRNERAGTLGFTNWLSGATAMAGAFFVLFPASHAHALAPAISTVTVNCFSRESGTAEGALNASCLHLQDSIDGHTEATAQTFLGTRPGASVGAFRNNTPRHFRLQVEAQAQLTYEFRIAPTGPTPIALTSIPVKVAILGQTSREETFNDGPASPAAGANASVFIRSDPSILPVAADVLRESTISNAPAFPDFDKIVSLSLIPGHIYTVDVSAGCVHSDSSSVPSQFSGSAGCTAVADPTFTLDQAALDTQLGTHTFALASFYQLEFSPGVTAVPEPSTYALMLAGLGLVGFAAFRRHV